MQRYFAILTLLASLVYSSPWNYTDKGISQWGKINQEWALCDIGQMQSPIDIQTQNTIKKPMELSFSYPLDSKSIIDNGHTLQLDFEAGNTMRWMGASYELRQFHLHMPSEHTIDRRGFPLEVHFVHQNSEGKLLVLAVLFEEGEANQAIQSIIDALPLQKGVKKPLKLRLNPPEKLAFYSFEGSLTTPPCSENVQWIVMKQPLQISKAQIQALLKVTGSNARPTQNLNHRTIYETP